MDYKIHKWQPAMLMLALLKAVSLRFRVFLSVYEKYNCMGEADFDVQKWWEFRFNYLTLLEKRLLGSGTLQMRSPVCAEDTCALTT